MRSAEFWRGSSAYPRLADRSDPRRDHADHERGRLRQRYGQPHAHQLEKGRQQINDGSDIADAAVHCHRLLISVEQQKAVHQQYRDRRGEGQPEGGEGYPQNIFPECPQVFPARQGKTAFFHQKEQDGSNQRDCLPDDRGQRRAGHPPVYDPDQCVAQKDVGDEAENHGGHGKGCAVHVDKVQ